MLIWECNKQVSVIKTGLVPFLTKYLLCSLVLINISLESPGINNSSCFEQHLSSVQEWCLHSKYACCQYLDPWLSNNGLQEMKWERRSGMRKGKEKKMKELGGRKVDKKKERGVSFVVVG